MSNKLHKFRKRGTELAFKRYAGNIIEVKEDIIPYLPRQYEYQNYTHRLWMPSTKYVGKYGKIILLWLELQ